MSAVMPLPDRPADGPLVVEAPINNVHEPATIEEEDEHPALRIMRKKEALWQQRRCVIIGRVRYQVKLSSYTCHRMVSTIPPPNYGTVEAGRIYRSAYPSQENLPFLAGLGLKSILILVEGPHEATYSAWIKDNAKKLYTVPLPANKDGVQMQIKTIAMIIDILSDETNYPMLIHCNKGKHRTGCTVGAWRKLHGSSMHEILGEYRTYAGNKARPNDEVFLTKLNVPSLRDYMRHGSLHEEIDLGVIDPTTGRHYWPFRADHEMNARVKISRSLVPVASESSAPVPSVTVVPVSAASLVPVKRTNGATSPKMKACRLET